LTLVASVLIVTYNSVGASIAGLSDLKTTLTAQISVLTKNVPHESVPFFYVYFSLKGPSDVDKVVQFRLPIKSANKNLSSVVQKSAEFVCH